MKRWALFVSLAACAAVVMGCGHQEAAPDPTWPAVAAKCPEHLNDFPTFGDRTIAVYAYDNCEDFVYRPFDAPPEWQQVEEKTFYHWAEAGPPVLDTTRVVGEPEPDEVFVEEFLDYAPWRHPISGDLDPEGQRIDDVELLGMGYFPLYRWGCQAPENPEVTLRCKLTLSISTRVSQSKEIYNSLGLRLGIGDTSNGIGGDVGVKRETSVKQVLSTVVRDTYAAVVFHDLDRSEEDNKWFVAFVRHYRTYLIRDISECKRYRKTVLGLTRDRLYCQGIGMEYQRIEGLDLFHLAAYTLSELPNVIAYIFPGVDMPPEAQTMLSDLEQVSSRFALTTSTMPPMISCETNHECGSHVVTVEVTDSTMSRLGLSVSVGGGQAKAFNLTGTGGLGITTESTISTQQEHRLDFEAGGKAHQRVMQFYRQTELQNGKTVGSYYVNGPLAKER